MREMNNQLCPMSWRRTMLKPGLVACAFIMSIMVSGASLSQSTSLSQSKQSDDLGVSDKAHDRNKDSTYSASRVVYRQRSNNPFNALVGRRARRATAPQQPRRVQRYVLDGNRAFLFLDRGQRVQIQFLCGARDPRFECKLASGRNASEIVNLQATRAPRGDVIYKDRYGKTVLRIASYGGATVWWPGEQEARAASKSFSDLRDLRLPSVNNRVVANRAVRAQLMLEKMTGRAISFDTGVFVPALRPQTYVPSADVFVEQVLSALEATEVEVNTFDLEAGDVSAVQEIPDLPEDADSVEASVLADSVLVASKGMATVAADPIGARVMGSRLEVVRFIKADEPKLMLENRVLQLHYNPSLGIAGRPSSAEIIQFLENNL